VASIDHLITDDVRTDPLVVGHLALAHDDDVYQQMLTWWTTP